MRPCVMVSMKRSLVWNLQLYIHLLLKRMEIEYFHHEKENTVLEDSHQQKHGHCVETAQVKTGEESPMGHLAIRDYEYLG
mmetsp:Transcript_15241/g.18062  ORF Transcript_15241/g.18062 Transcript_15241/m.18062 type:complete len:80 (-) Transcript_15241:1806-2045(-)